MDNQSTGAIYDDKMTLSQLIKAMHNINIVLTTHIGLYHNKQVNVLNQMGNMELDKSIEPHKSLHLAVTEGYNMSNNVIHFLNQSKKLLDEMQVLMPIDFIIDSNQ